MQKQDHLLILFSQSYRAEAEGIGYKASMAGMPPSQLVAAQQAISFLLRFYDFGREQENRWLPIIKLASCSRLFGVNKRSVKPINNEENIMPERIIQIGG